MRLSVVRLSVRPVRLSVRRVRLSVRPVRLSVRPVRLSVSPVRLSVRTTGAHELAAHCPGEVRQFGHWGGGCR